MPETPSCDMCGAELTTDTRGPAAMGLTEDGRPVCPRCAGKEVGYTQGQEQSARELLEVAVLWAARDIGEEGVRAEVERLLETGRPMYVEIR